VAHVRREQDNGHAPLPEFPVEDVPALEAGGQALLEIRQG